jgi:hypothetical protein
MRTVRHPKPILVAFATLLLASLASTVAGLTLDYSFEYNTDRSGATTATATAAAPTTTSNWRRTP